MYILNTVDKFRSQRHHRIKMAGLLISGCETDYDIVMV